MIAGLAVGAAGLALVVGGIVAGVLAKNAADEISQADATHQPFDPEKYAAWENNLLATGVLAGIGGAAVVAGTALAVVGLRRNRAPRTAWQMAPLLSPTHAGMTATIRF
jgi:drug/metabolite transporter (DMT)-like permease